MIDGRIDDAVVRWRIPPETAKLGVGPAGSFLVHAAVFIRGLWLGRYRKDSVAVSPERDRIAMASHAAGENIHKSEYDGRAPSPVAFP